MKLYGQKTYYSCIEAAAEEISKLKGGLKGNIVVFCEDKLTLSVEEAIVKKLGGTFNVEVLTFGRYISEKKADAKALSKESAAIAVKKILGNLKSELKVLSRLSASPSFAFETSELIAQLKSAKVKPDELLKASFGCRENVRAKIADVALIFGAYEKFLKEKGLTDQSGVLDVMPSLIEKDEKLKKSDVFIVGFSSVTKQTCEIIKTLGKCVSSLSVFACRGDNENLYLNEFYNFVSSLPSAAKKDVKTESLLPEAEALLSGLFDHSIFQKAGLYSDKVHIFEGNNVRDEIEFAAKQITYLVINKGYRYSDFCLAVGNLPASKLQIKKIFDDYSVPYFSDEKHSLSSHPLARLTISVLKAAARGGDLDEIKNVILNPLFIPDRKTADDFIKILTKNSVTAKLFLSDEFSFSDDIYISGKRDALKYAIKSFSKTDKTSEFVRKVLSFYEAAGTEENTEQTALKLSAVSAEEESSFLTSATEKVSEVVKMTGDVLENDEITINEFIKLLEAGFKACEVGLIPQTRDCVYVGELKDCRYKKYKKLFAMSLTGEVPFVKSDAALLMDSDIAGLEELSVSIEPKISVVNKREKEAAGISLASFSETLFLSYSLSSPSGAQLVRSEIIDYAQAIFTNKNGAPIRAFDKRSIEKEAEEGENEERKTLYSSLPYMRFRPAVFSFIKDADNYKNGAISLLTRISSFHQAVKTYNGGREFPYIESLLNKINEEMVFRKNIPTENYFRKGAVSASKLECFFSCPYKCFVKYGLGAADKLTGEVRSLDFGNVLHDVAEEFVKCMDEMTDETWEEKAVEIIRKVLSDPKISKFSRRGDFAYALKLTEKEGKKLCRDIWSEFKNSGFKPVGEEVCFSEWSEYKPIRLYTKKGSFRVDGKADRVDKYKNYVRIVDYKTGNASEKVKEEKFYTGQNIQLYLYMNAFVRTGERPAGAYYYAVNDSFSKPDDEKAPMAGKTLMNDEILNATDPEILKTGKSKVVNVKTDKRSGRITSGACDEITLEGYMKYAKKLAENAVFNIADGVIVPSPYQGACNYCEYGGICGFDEDAGYKERKISGVKPKTIVEAAFSDEKNENNENNEKDEKTEKIENAKKTEEEK